MNIGQRTCCPNCKKIHTLGVRWEAPKRSMRFCSKQCEETMSNKIENKIKKLQEAAAIEAPPELRQVTRASITMTVYCNCCVSSFQWAAALDGSDCPLCGYRLSRYGPFETPPSIVRTTIRTF